MIKCIKCNRTLEDVREQDGCFSMSSDEPFMCNSCKEREENSNWWENLKKIFRVEEKNKQISQLQDSLRDANECLGQIYSHLGVEAFGKDIQEQAVKEIDRLMDYKRNKLFKNHWRNYDRKK